MADPKRIARYRAALIGNAPVAPAATAFSRKVAPATRPTGRSTEVGKVVRPRSPGQIAVSRGPRMTGSRPTPGSVTPPPAPKAAPVVRIPNAPKTPAGTSRSTAPRMILHSTSAGDTARARRSS